MKLKYSQGSVSSEKLFLKERKKKTTLFRETTFQRLYNVFFTTSNKTAPNYQTYEETENVAYTEGQSMKTDPQRQRCWN